MNGLRGILFLLISFYSIASTSHAQVNDEIVAALDDPLVAIDTSFAGSKVLLFGATEGEGDVVVIVRGPSREETVRKKDRVMGVWANKEQVTFTDTPSYYSIAASGDVETLVPQELRKRLEFGPDNLNTYLAPEYKSIDEDKKKEFWEALVRVKKNDGLYSEAPVDVQFLGKRLFRADFIFPSNLPVGTYLVYVYLIKDKDVVNTKITPLYVSKIGLEAGIFDFAQRFSIAYGFFAVIIALFAGWLASVVFRKK